MWVLVHHAPLQLSGQVDYFLLDSDERVVIILAIWNRKVFWFQYLVCSLGTRLHYLSIVALEIDSANLANC